MRSHRDSYRFRLQKMSRFRKTDLEQTQKMDILIDSDIFGRIVEVIYKIHKKTKFNERFGSNRIRIQTKETQIALDGEIVAEVTNIWIQIGPTQGSSPRARRRGGGFGLAIPRPWHAGGDGLGPELRFRRPVEEVREEVRWRKGEAAGSWEGMWEWTPRPAKCTCPLRSL
jgi:hypothetical protein